MSANPHRLFLPGSIPTAAGDLIVIHGWASIAGITIEVSGITITDRGDESTFAFTLAPTSDRVLTGSTFDIGRGILISATARATAGGPKRGQCYVKVFLRRGSLPGVPRILTLIQSYLTDDFDPSWPGSSLHSPLEGPGVLRVVTGTDQAAGVEITETVPTNTRWRFYGMRASLTTSGAGVARQVSFIFDDGASAWWRVFDVSTQAVSTTEPYNLSPYGVFQASIVGAHHTVIPPNLFLAGGYRIRTVTATLDAADNWGAPVMFVEEWIEE